MPKKNKSTGPKTYNHIAISNARIGSNEDGSAKRIINIGDNLKLTYAQVRSYRILKIIK